MPSIEISAAERPPDRDKPSTRIAASATAPGPVVRANRGVAATWALARRRAASFFWCIASGAISVYLGALDVLFDLENGIYTAADGNTGGVIVELIINVLTLSLGAVVMIWAWAQRRQLLRLAGF